MLRGYAVSGRMDWRNERGRPFREKATAVGAADRAAACGVLEKSRLSQEPRGPQPPGGGGPPFAAGFVRRHSAGLRPKTTVEKTDAAGFRIGVVCRQKSGAAYSLGRERGACVGGEDTPDQ